MEDNTATIELIPTGETIRPADDTTALPAEEYHKKGILKVKCKCGHVNNVTDEVIIDGISWTMLIGNEHFVRLTCPECESELTLFIDEIIEDNAISEKSN